MNETPRTALVTGASAGIGKQIARQLLQAGLRVHIGARDPQRGQATVEELGDQAHLLPLDVTDPSSIESAAAAVVELDVLVNNAGISGPLSPESKDDADELRRIYETNVFGLAAVTNAFLAALRQSAHPRIVNISSGTGSLAWSTSVNPQFDHRTGGAGAAYRSSKTAVNALTVFYAQSLQDAGILVNALAPGLRATNLNPVAASRGGDPAEAAAGAVRLALLPDDGPSGSFFSWDGSVVPW